MVVPQHFRTAHFRRSLMILTSWVHRHEWWRHSRISLRSSHCSAFACSLRNVRRGPLPGPRHLEYFQRVSVMPRRGNDCLGVPLGTEEYVGGFLSSAIEEDRRGLDQLQHLGDPQVAIRILTHVFAHRPSYLLRSCPPTPAFLECMRDYDSAM